MEKTESIQGEEEFIDIEVNSSPQSSREFEFQMMPSSSTSSPPKQSSTADELFFNGKLLPLQMVQSLLQNQKKEGGRSTEASRSFTAPPTISNTPTDQSCNISPVESCRVSCELNPDEYFFNWSTTEVSSFFNGGATSNKVWCKKIRLIKKYSLTQKLKSSRAYLKSLFLSSSCSDEAKLAWNLSRAKESFSKYIKLVKKNPEPSSCCTNTTMKSMLDREIDDHVSFTCHRKSFSGAIKRHCTSKCYNSSSASASASTSSGSSSTCSSSSSSFSLKNSAGFSEVKILKRSISANSDVENSIQGAIAHCKKSQLKSEELRPCLVSSASIVAERPEISRI